VDVIERSSRSDLAKGRVVIAGGTGLIGKALANYLDYSGYEVVVLTRGEDTSTSFRQGRWDAEKIGPWAKELEGAKAIINVCGSSVSVPWSPENRRKILQSRILPTKAIATALQQCADPPPTWINASATGYYGDTGATVVDEQSPPGTDFLASVCKAWEAATEGAPDSIRVVKMRVGVVLAKEGGALAPLAKLTKMFLGGAQGSGKQWVSWIHVQDLCRLVEWEMRERNAPNVVNACSPMPVTNGDFMIALRKALKRPWSPPAPEVIIRLSAKIMKVEPDILLLGTRAIPKAAEAAGFEYKFVMIADAVANLTKG
jgi:uncharacterized protein